MSCFFLCMEKLDFFFKSRLVLFCCSAVFIMSTVQGFVLACYSPASWIPCNLQGGVGGCPVVIANPSLDCPSWNNGSQFLGQPCNINKTWLDTPQEYSSLVTASGYNAVGSFTWVCQEGQDCISGVLFVPTIVVNCTTIGVPYTCSTVTLESVGGGTCGPPGGGGGGGGGGGS